MEDTTLALCTESLIPPQRRLRQEAAVYYRIVQQELVLLACL